MNVVIMGTPKEIAALVLAVQGRQENPAGGFGNDFNDFIAEAVARSIRDQSSPHHGSRST